MRRALLFGVALLLFASRARADAPPCIASATLSRERAFVGEAIEHRLRVLRRTDVADVRWAVAPDLVGFRIAMAPGRFVESRVERDGRHYLVYEERRVLVPLREGRLAIAPSELECRLHPAARAEQELVRVSLDGAEIEAVAVPSTDRPVDWSGVVGALEIALRTPARSVSLGRSLRLDVVYAGPGNVWDAPPPFGGARELDGVELVPGETREEVDVVPALRVRRHFVLDLVPLRAGMLALPPIELVTFDPASGRFERVSASLPPLVVEEAPPDASARQRDDGASPGREGAPADRGALGPGLAAAAIVLASLAGGALGVWRLWRRRAKRDSDVRDGETDLVARLRAALVRRLEPEGAAAALSAHELLARATPGSVEAEAAALLSRIESSRFRAGSGAGVEAVAGDAVDAVDLRAALRALGERA